MIEAIKRVVGRSDLPVRRLPWHLMGFASPFVPLFRELREVKYLWEQPVRMTNARLLSVIGEEPHTPLDEAVRATLKGLGCLRQSEQPAQNASVAMCRHGRF